MPCSAKNVKKLKYPLSRFIFLVLPTANPNPLIQRFADWVRTSPVAGKVIAKSGGVPGVQPHRQEEEVGR